MCESSIYLLTEGEERLILEDVDIIEILGDKIRIVDVFGEERMIRAKIRRFSLLEHKILFEPLFDH